MVEMEYREWRREKEYREWRRPTDSLIIHGVNIKNVQTGAKCLLNIHKGAESQFRPNIFQVSQFPAPFSGFSL